VSLRAIILWLRLIGMKADVPPEALQLIRSIKGVLSARIILGAENKI
jgi:hypothetical protein